MVTIKETIVFANPFGFITFGQIFEKHNGFRKIPF